MENQLRKLTLDFHQASSKQEQNTDVLSRRLETLKSQLEETRSSVKSALPSGSSPAYPSLPTTSVPQERNPFTPPTAQYNSNSNPSGQPPRTSKVQEDTDAQIARQLQEEFDREQEEERKRQQQQQQQQQMRQQQQQQAYAPPSNNYSMPPPAAAAPSPAPSGQQRQQEECPMCGLSFPVGKELLEHANSHFPDQQITQQQQQMVMRQMQQQQAQPRPTSGQEEPG